MKERTLTLERGNVAARVTGPADGPRVLALHGWLDNAASFAALAEHLPGVHLVAVDLPGHGHSDHHPPGFPYHFSDYVAAVAEVVDALGWRSCSLVGHSLGAGIAAVFAAAQPSCAERLILLDGLGPLSETERDTPVRLARALNEERNANTQQVPVYPDIATVLERLAAVRSVPTEAELALLERGLREVLGGVTWRSDPRLRWPSRVRLTEAQILALLRAVTAPVLFVAATRGFRMAEAVTRARLEALAPSRILELDGHHHIHCERPAEVGEAISRFLQEAG